MTKTSQICYNKNVVRIDNKIMNLLQKDLKSIGLSENEAVAYLALLELGEASVGEIAKKAELKRPTTYLIMESLKEKALISMVKRKKKTLFLAEDPRKINEILEERKRKIDKIMPQLLSITNSLEVKPKIQYFEGEEGIKNVYRDTLRYPNQEMLAFFSDSYARGFEEDFFENYYFQKRVEKKIWVRAILPNQKMTRSLMVRDREHLRKTKLVSSELYRIEVEVNIYGKNRIGIISFEEKFALIVESQKISQSLKSIFELLWSLLPEHKHNA